MKAFLLLTEAQLFYFFYFVNVNGLLKVHNAITALKWILHVGFTKENTC